MPSKNIIGSQHKLSYSPVESRPKKSPPPTENQTYIFSGHSANSYLMYVETKN